MRAFLFVLLATVACGPSFSYTKTNEPPRTLVQRRPAAIEIHALPPTDRAFVEVGIIEADDPTLDTSAQTSRVMLQRFREQAGKIGCDAIVLGSPNHVNAGISSYDRYHATCIVYR